MRARAQLSGRVAEIVLGAAILYFLALAVTMALRAPWHSAGVRWTVFAVSFVAVTTLIRLLLSGRSALKANFALAIASVFLTIYVAEALLAFIEYPVSRAKRAARQGVAFDDRSQFDVLRDLRRAGDQAYPFVGPAWLAGLGKDGILPLAGLSYTTTVNCNESGDYMVYRADQHGFNNTPAAWPTRADVLLLGDSFTHGACVAPGDDIAGQLRERGLAAVNLGMGSDGPLLALATLVEYAAGLEPRVVFWNYFEGNDLEELTAELRSGTLRRYLEDETFSQGLRAGQREVDAVLKAYLDEALYWEGRDGWRARLARRFAPARMKARLNDVKRFAKLRRLRKRMGMVPGLVGGLRAPDPAFAEILSRADRLVASWGGELVFVYLPDFHHFTGHLDFAHRQAVLDTVRELGLPIVDLVPVFSRFDDPAALFPLRMDGHYAPQGYALVADELEAFYRR